MKQLSKIENKDSQGVLVTKADAPVLSSRI